MKQFRNHVAAPLCRRALTRRRSAAAITILLISGLCAHAADLVVAKKGATPFKTIQSALDTAAPGDTITVEAGVYAERITFSKSGSEEQGWITLRAAPGAKVELDGRRGFAKHMVDIQERQYVRLIGFDISKNLGVRDSAGIHVGGPCQHVEIISNTVHETRGTRATGIMVENTDAGAASHITIQGNTVYDVQPAPSGAITVSGNVTDWLVADNVTHDVNEAGIRIECGAVAADSVVRNGVCRGNRVARSHAAQGDGYVPGILVDGAKDSVIEGNLVTESDRGLEIGAETSGRDTTGLSVRDNIVFGNSKSGFVFGGYKQGAGRVRDCSFSGNISYHNDTQQMGFGELWIQWSGGNTVYSNIFVCGSGDLLLMCPDSGAGEMNHLNHNIWHSERGDQTTVTFVWDSREIQGFKAYVLTTGQDAKGRFINPGFIDPAATNFARKPVVAEEKQPEKKKR